MRHVRISQINLQLTEVRIVIEAANISSPCILIMTVLSDI